MRTMIDDFSRFPVVYLLEKKSEAPEKVKEYVGYAENLFNRKQRIVRSDGGGDYAKHSSQQRIHHNNGGTGGNLNIVT